MPPGAACETGRRREPRRRGRVAPSLRVAVEQAVDERDRGGRRARRRRPRATVPARRRDAGPSPACPRPRRASGPRASGRGCSRAHRDRSPGRSRGRRPARAPSTRAFRRARRRPGALRDERASRASPKSVTTTRPVPRSTSTFAGVRSRWTTPRRVRVRERRGDRGAVPPCLVPVERSPCDQRVERDALDELHDEHRLAVVLEHVVETNDVRVLEPCQSGRLALEPLAQLGIVGDPRVEHLERDVASEPLVARTPDHAHAAAPDLLAEAIPVGDDVVDVLQGGTCTGIPGRPGTYSCLVRRSLTRSCAGRRLGAWRSAHSAGARAPTTSGSVPAAARLSASRRRARCARSSRCCSAT